MFVRLSASTPLAVVAGSVAVGQASAEKLKRLRRVKRSSR